MKHEPNSNIHACRSRPRRDRDDLVDIAMSWGWSLEIGFVMALQLRSNGVTAATARWRFSDGLQRVQ
jgi:hypothetical protein